MKQNAIMTGITNASSAAWIPPTVTFASPPASPVSGTLYLFTDAASSGANSGGGSSLSQCVWSGSGWVATSGSGGAVSSVFGRTGAVVAASGDYSAFYVSLTGSYASPSWLTQINWSIVTGAPAFLVNPLTTKGDIIGYSTTPVRVGVGANNTILMADSTQTPGIKWGTPTAGMITNAVDQTGSYANPAWITSLPWTKITGVPGNVGLWQQGSAGAIYYAGGPVGINAGSPGATLECNGMIRTTNTTSLTTGSGVELWWDGSNGSLDCYNRTTSAYLPLYIEGSQLTLNTHGGYVFTGGYVSIGASSNPIGPCTSTSSGFVPASNITASFVATGGYGGGLIFTASGISAGMWITGGPTTLHFRADGSSSAFPGVSGQMCLVSNGYLGIGTSNPSYQIQLSTDSAGKLSTSTWTVASDVRMKRNVKDLAGGLDVISRLRPVEAEYNGLGGTSAGTRAVGFLAHEVREILPQCVGSHPETGMLDLNIHEILIHLILAVQQLAKKGVTL